MNAIFEYLRTALHTTVAYAWWAKVEISSRLGAAKKSRSSSNRDVLLLAWALPPIVGGGVYRPTSFLKYGTRLGWSMSAISGPVTEDSGGAGRYLLDMIPETVRIHRLDRPRLRPSWRFFPRIDGGFVNALATAQQAFRTFKDKPPMVEIYRRYESYRISTLSLNVAVWQSFVYGTGCGTLGNASWISRS